MNREKKGSILLEVISAMAIVLIVIGVSYRICITMGKVSGREKSIYRDRETIKALSSEIKYNISFLELKEALKDTFIQIKYNEDFLNQLLDKKVLDFQRCESDKNSVKIQLLNEQSESVDIRIELNDNNTIYTEEFEKGLWMDYA